MRELIIDTKCSSCASSIFDLRAFKENGSTYLRMNYGIGKTLDSADYLEKFTTLILRYLAIKCPVFSYGDV